jgi:2-oxoglutarate ferredoxin oxidoreductase subunit gamma
MSQEAAEKNIKDLKEDGMLLVDSSTVEKIPETKAETIRIPATQIAEKTTGEKLYANMVILGALTKMIKSIDEESMRKAIEEAVPKSVIALNFQAYEQGLAHR